MRLLLALIYAVQLTVGNAEVHVSDSEAEYGWDMRTFDL